MGDAVGGPGKVTFMLVVDAALTVEPLGAVNKIKNQLSTNACSLISSPVMIAKGATLGRIFCSHLSTYCVKGRL